MIAHHEGPVILKRLHVHYDKPKEWQEIFSQEFPSKEEAEDYVRTQGWHPASEEDLIKMETVEGELVPFSAFL